MPGGETANVQVEVDPPDDVPAGGYPVVVRATGGGRTVEAELTVEITGSYALTLTTPDERLDLEAVAGRPAEVTFVVRNDGTAPLAGVELTADPPADWDVAFEPAAVEALPPGEAAEVVARITPADDAVAGDYVVSVDARAEQAEAAAELRATVETSPWWGAVGLSLIVAALGALGAVFRRYGRR